MTAPILSDAEKERLILSLAGQRGDSGFREKEAEELIDWAENVRVEFAALELVLGGKAEIEWKGKQWMLHMNNGGLK